MALPEEFAEELADQTVPTPAAEASEPLFTTGEVVLGSVMFFSGVVFTLNEAAPKVLEASAHFAGDPKNLLIAAVALVGTGVVWKELNKSDADTGDTPATTDDEQTA